MSPVAFELRDGKARYDDRTLAEWVPDVVDLVVGARSPEEVLLLGSVARGDGGTESDLELMVGCSSIDYTKRHELEATPSGVLDGALRCRSLSPTAASASAAATSSAPCTTGRSEKDGSSMPELRPTGPTRMPSPRQALSSRAAWQSLPSRSWPGSKDS